MSSELLERVAARCALGSATSALQPSFKPGRMVLVDRDVLEKLLEEPSQIVATMAERSWVKIEPPPPGFNAVEILFLLLASVGYTVNPTSFDWERATNRTYISIWRLLERLSWQLKDSFPLISANLRSRSGDGFANSRQVGTVLTPLYPMIYNEDPSLAQYLTEHAAQCEAGDETEFGHVSSGSESDWDSSSDSTEGSDWSSSSNSRSQPRRERTWRDRVETEDLLESELLPQLRLQRGLNLSWDAEAPELVLGPHLEFTFESRLSTMSLI